jgi:hypothetical protein
MSGGREPLNRARIDAMCAGILRHDDDISLDTTAKDAVGDEDVERDDERNAAGG